MTIPVAPTPTALQLTGSVSTETSRLATRDNLDAAGAKFESIFINMMLKSMRQAQLAPGLFDSQAQRQFRDMQDQKLAETMATHTPLGIGKAMTDFIARNAELDGTAAPAATPPAGDVP